MGHFKDIPSQCNQNLDPDLNNNNDYIENRMCFKSISKFRGSMETAKLSMR